MNVEIVGFIAGSLIAFSLLPQLIKSYRTKSTGDLSLLWNLINLAGQVLWIVYGWMITSASLVIMSGITLAMAVTLLSMKWRYDNKIVR